MLKRKTIAIFVSNLSDARYFAAYDVDAMAFLVAPEGDNLGLIREMIEWIEGPKVYLQFENWDKDLVAFAMQECQAEGVLVPYDRRPRTNVDHDLMFIHDDTSKLKEFPENKMAQHIFKISSADVPALSSETAAYVLPKDITHDEVASMIKEHVNCGFALVGGTEEKVGFKSFDEQDEIIEQLFEE
jgi:phosphoribosylanthranilate isomerase